MHPGMFRWEHHQSLIFFNVTPLIDPLFLNHLLNITKLHTFNNAYLFWGYLGVILLRHDNPLIKIIFINTNGSYLYFNMWLTGAIFYLYFSIEMTGSRPICPLSYHFPVHSKNNYQFVVLNPQLKKEIFKLCVVCKQILPGIKLSLGTVR